MSGRVDAVVDRGDGRVERALGHVLVALVEQLAHLDEARRRRRPPVPRVAGHRASAPSSRRRGRPARSRSGAAPGRPARRSRGRRRCPSPWNITRLPSSRSTHTRGSGATNGAGMAWLITKVWTVPVRASGTASNLSPPQTRQAGWIAGGNDTVAQSTQRPPMSPRISALPRTNIALPGRHGHLDVLAGRLELAPSPEHLRVATRDTLAPRGRRRPARRPAPARGPRQPPRWPGRRRRRGARRRPVRRARARRRSAAAAAPVSPSARRTSDETTWSVPILRASAAPSRPSGSGSDQRESVGAERGGGLGREREEDLLAEEPPVVDVAGGVLVVAAVAVEGGHPAAGPGAEQRRARRPRPARAAPPSRPRRRRARATCRCRAAARRW